MYYSREVHMYLCVVMYPCIDNKHNQLPAKYVLFVLCVYVVYNAWQTHSIIGGDLFLFFLNGWLEIF